MTENITQNFFSGESSLTKILLSILYEDNEFSNYMQELVNNTSKIGDLTNE